MRLDPDCIRDILLCIESKTDAEKDSLELDELINSLTSYDENKLIYHLKQLSTSNFLDICFSGDEIEYISDLSFEGHQFLSNIRSNPNWNKIKNIAKTVGSFSINSLNQIAINVISQAIQNQFH